MNVEHVVSTPDAERLILYVARVSSDQSNESTGLINYLIRNGHWSPFEHAFMTVEIETSRAIAQQILRHRSFTFQEFSQRYAIPTEYEAYDARLRSEKNRQSSLEPLNEGDQQWWHKTQEEVWEFAIERYDAALDLGVAKECARFILPLSTQTKLYMTGSLRSWIHYLDPNNPGGRTTEHTQLEHRLIALEIQAIFKDEFPTIAEAMEF